MTRLRYLGGSSNHWAGWCRKLEAHDFRPPDPAAVHRALEKERGKHDLAVRQRHRGKGPPRTARSTYEDPGEAMGSVIGRRVGRGTTAVDRALARPEKARRDAYLDTAAPGVSATARKAGGGSSARRNALARPRRATATLEDSRGTPSRKSTRRSANRAKQSQLKETTSRLSINAPSARHQRGPATARRITKRG